MTNPESAFYQLVEDAMRSVHDMLPTTSITDDILESIKTGAASLKKMYDAGADAVFLQASNDDRSISFQLYSEPSVSHPHCFVTYSAPPPDIGATHHISVFVDWSQKIGREHSLEIFKSWMFNGCSVEEMRNNYKIQ